MKNLYLGCKFAFSYFSILPIWFDKEDDLSSKNILGAMLFFLPLVGLVLGLFTIALFYLLSSLGWYGAIVSAIFYMLLYGFLHTEAVLDVGDALYASHSGKDAYTIIKDPTVGAMGVLYAIALVLLKVSGIIFLLLHNLLFEFVAILIISRLSLLMLFRVYSFRSLFATQLKEALSPRYLWSAYAIFTLIGLFLTPYFILLLVLGVIIAYTTIYILKSKLGFVNGDLLGATLEFVEVVLFLVVAMGYTVTL